MEQHQLTASIFADKIGVQRSSISHILSGRNKPSLDFILKVTNTFTDVDIYWLLNGKGNYPSTPSSQSSSKLFSIEDQQEALDIIKNPAKRISRIVVFYTDGTFDEYNKG